jgi:hypothetical protein
MSMIGIMTEIALPRLVGSRLAAQSLVAALGADVHGGTVVINCRNLRSATPSFVDELVTSVLLEGEAAEMIVMGADETFLGYVTESAKAHGVVDRISDRPAGSVAVPEPRRV